MLPINLNIEEINTDVRPERNTMLRKIFKGYELDFIEADIIPTTFEKAINCKTEK